MVDDVLGLVHAAGDQAAPPHAPDESKPSAHKARARADLVRRDPVELQRAQQRRERRRRRPEARRQSIVASEALPLLV